MTASARYAIYYAPDASSDLWRFGSRVIGYDAATGLDAPYDKPPGYSCTEWQALTGDASKYGFHATLKAPFRLAATSNRDELVDAVAQLAGRLERVAIGPLMVAPIGPYVALVPREPSSALSACVQTIVEDLEPYRTPLTQAERERRKPALLSARQLELLDRYGYPYVAEEFRYHMTLAGPLPDDARGAIIEALDRKYRAIAPKSEIWLDRIAIFEQAAPKSRFRVIASCAIR